MRPHVLYFSNLILQEDEVADEVAPPYDSSKIAR